MCGFHRLGLHAGPYLLFHLTPGSGNDELQEDKEDTEVAVDVRSPFS